MAFNYLVVYILLSVALFIFIVCVRPRTIFGKFKLITDYKYLTSNSFFLAVLFILIFFSFASVPPLSGFFIKFFLFKFMFLVVLLKNSYFFIIFFLTIISTFYYIRVVRFVFFNSKPRIAFFLTSLPFFINFFIVFLGFFVMFFIIFYEFFLISVGICANSIFL